MTLKEFQEKYGISRINFDEVHRNSDLDEEMEEDRIKCPYCGYVFEFEGEEIDDILGGQTYQCPECEKNFYVYGETSITTYSKPLEDEVIDRRNWIERTYQSIDELDAKGFDFPEDRYGFTEWEIFRDYARPLLENKQKDS